MNVTMFPAITLDGFISDLNGGCYSWVNSDDERAYEEAVKAAGCVLVGRRTYEQYIDDPMQLGVTEFVYTSQTHQKDTEHVKFLRGTPAEIIQQIANRGFRELIVSGGGEVNGALAEARLIDEIKVSIYNVVLGEGIPLFGTHKPKLGLELLATKQEVPGIVRNHYRVIK